MYIFNKITVVPQLPEKIRRLEEISYNLWWSWNTEFLKLFQIIDVELWEKCKKNPIKFLKLVDQSKLEKYANDETFLKKYNSIVADFDGYMNSKDTWFTRNHPNNKNDLIAYFSAEYGLDEILPIYSGGLGILSGDHIKSASDLDIPFVAVGMLYKYGYFDQRVDSDGQQINQYHLADINNLPIIPLKDDDGNDVIIDIDLENRKCYLKIWKIRVGRKELYLMDSDIEKNDPDYRELTLHLYGGDRLMRIRQEIILGMAGLKLLKTLNLNPTIFHMNEGHSAFLTIQLVADIMKEKQVSFEIAKEYVTTRTVFTTHTPVPAGNDIFDAELVDSHFNHFYNEFGLSKEEFLRLGMKDNEGLDQGFNMGILALRFAGKKNGVSKLHGEVSRELFADVWPNIAQDESPITYVTNGIHTCTWLAPNLKRLFNEYLDPFWQDRIHEKDTWKKIDTIPDQRLWAEHVKRKQKLITFIKRNLSHRFLTSGLGFETVNEITNYLNPEALTIGFARRFATYKRATLIFKNIEKLTQIMNDVDRPVQLIFAGKAHPQDQGGMDLIKFIHKVSLMPQFRGKIFILENYNIGMSRYLVSGVDVWLNNPRRPMEASGTSGEKASVNGVVNCSVLDGWWAEGYDETNGWAIGTHAEYASYEEQDRADSDSLYHLLEDKIIPAYYDRDENGISHKWLEYMKNSIKTTAGQYSTARMLVDYTNQLYMPLCDNYNENYQSIENVINFADWKKTAKSVWNDIKITQEDIVDNVRYDAGAKIRVNCMVQLPNIDENNVEIQVYFGKIMEDGTIRNVFNKPMTKVNPTSKAKKQEYEAEIELSAGGNYGYTFRAVPKHKMLMNFADMDLIKWEVKEDK